MPRVRLRRYLSTTVLTARLVVNLITLVYVPFKDVARHITSLPFFIIVNPVNV